MMTGVESTPLAHYPSWIPASKVWLEEFSQQVETAGLRWMAPGVGCSEGGFWWVHWPSPKGSLVHFADGSTQFMGGSPGDPLKLYREWLEAQP